MVPRLIPVIFLLVSCSAPKEEKSAYVPPKENANGEKVVKAYHANGKIMSEVTMKNGKRNGVAKTYDKNGALLLELPYMNDLREGTSKKYYSGGVALAQTTEYKNDKMNGLKIRYRGMGTVMSEARYENDLPCAGLKEYLDSTRLRKKYLTIEVKMSKHLDANGAQTLMIKLSENVRSVKFYGGYLSKTGCLTDDLHYLRLDEATRTAEVPYYVQSSGNGEMNIIAVYETLMGNTAIAQHKFRVSN